ncbi:MAG: hypothetical protein ACUVUC_13660 [Thermoguttaceae bacterium]
MDINRNQVFLVGFVLVLLGVQLRLMDAAVLTPKATRLLAQQTDAPGATATAAIGSLAGDQAAPRKVIRPPDWLGWLLLSIGSVLILQSWTMAKPT